MTDTEINNDKETILRLTQDIQKLKREYKSVFESYSEEKIKREWAESHYDNLMEKILDKI
jgi:hypothetical protein